MPAWQRTDGRKQIVQYLQHEGGRGLFIWQLFSNAMASIVNPFLYVTNVKFFRLYMQSERFPEDSGILRDTVLHYLTPCWHKSILFDKAVNMLHPCFWKLRLSILNQFYMFTCGMIQSGVLEHSLPPGRWRCPNLFSFVLLCYQIQNEKQVCTNKDEPCIPICFI